jgi:hypothetical protein
MLIEEATNSNFLVFGFTLSGLEPMIYGILHFIFTLFLVTMKWL